MRFFVRIALVSLFFINTPSLYAADYPPGPHESTPGSLCTNGKTKYPEKVTVCKRSVSSRKKKKVIQNYETALGYDVYKYGRTNFKVDHLIPLCFGGSNSYDNLWPQHRSLYELTDPLEQKICGLLQQGRITQENAIYLILEAKKDPETNADIVMEIVSGL